MVEMRKLRSRLPFLIMFGIFVAAGYTGQAPAFTLSSTVEAISIPSVGGSFQTVNFQNTYANPIPVCTYNLPSGAPPAVVRIQSVGASSMSVRIQNPGGGSTPTPGPVYCLVAETGVNILPDGRRIQARSVLSLQTHGRLVPNAWNIASMNNVSGLFSGFTNAIALGQVMSNGDPDFSVFHANDCDNRRNPPFDTGFGDGICITKSVAEDPTTRTTETLGVIVIETGTGSYSGIAYEARQGANTIVGVDNGGSTYSLVADFEFVVATQGAENGGNGGWAVFNGAGSVGTSNLGLAIDEDQINDAERVHIAEQVAYFAIRRLPVFTATKNVDQPTIAEPVTLNYDIVLVNSGQLDQTGILVTDILPDSTPGTVVGPTESLTTDGIFEIGETWTYTVSYTVTPAEILAGSDLINNASITTDQYTAESQPDETASATTVIVPGAPSLSVTKTADDTSDVSVGQVLTYSYVVINTGNQTLSNLFLSDIHNGSGPAPSPANEALTNDTGPPGDSTDGTPNDGLWDSLGPGDEITFTATYTVTQNDIDTLQ